MLLAESLEPHTPHVAKVVFVVFLIATILVGGWLAGEWIVGDFTLAHTHPGYFLPTVAGSLVATGGAAEFGLPDVEWMAFEIGMFSWLVLGSVLISRLFFVDMLPAALVPTLAIELAPPAVAGSAYFGLHGAVPDRFAFVLEGYAVLMVLVQVRLVPLFLRLGFSPGFWAFTFSWSAVPAYALRGCSSSTLRARRSGRHWRGSGGGPDRRHRLAHRRGARLGVAAVRSRPERLRPPALVEGSAGSSRWVSATSVCSPSGVRTISTVEEPGGTVSLPGTPQVNTTRRGGLDLDVRLARRVGADVDRKDPAGLGT